MLSVFMQLAETSFDSYDYATTTELSGAQAAGLGAFFGAYFLFMLVFLVIMLVAMWKIFEKAGRPGWKALIPIYNYYIMLEIVGRPGWWLLLLFVPFVNLIVGILIMLDLAKAFGKDTLFAILGLIIFSPVGTLILGFGKDKYHGPQPIDLGSGSTQPPTKPAAE